MIGPLEMFRISIRFCKCSRGKKPAWFSGNGICGDCIIDVEKSGFAIVPPRKDENVGADAVGVIGDTKDDVTCADAGPASANDTKIARNNPKRRTVHLPR